MSATKLKMRWDEVLDKPSPTNPSEARNVFSRIGVEPRQHRCPSCSSIVYTRRHRRCGACGENLPEEFLFTVNESKNVQDLLTQERLRHRVWLKKIAAI